MTDSPKYLLDKCVPGVYNGLRGGDTMARYNITLPDNVVQLADRKAAEMGISRSAFIATAIQFKAQYDETMLQMPKMIQFLDDVRSGKISPAQISGSAGSGSTSVAVMGDEGEA